jgi:hypothetical protein
VAIREINYRVTYSLVTFLFNYFTRDFLFFIYDYWFKKVLLMLEIAFVCVRTYVCVSTRAREKDCRRPPVGGGRWGGVGETDRQTDRQTGRQADKQADRETESEGIHLKLRKLRFS